MKKIFNSLKRQGKLIVSFVLGLVVATTISYGVNQIQSSSVSYTRNGKTMSVEQAIDDLIVKVNKKNLDIRIAIDSNLWLKTAIENATYESSNDNVATVDENGLVTGKSIGTTKITVKNDNISSSVNVTVAGKYLADVAQVGDYVAYDAGSWTETKAKPTSQGQFGGYTKDQNKANSVACYDSTTLKGWQVYSIDTSTKTVTLIHAGQSECYYHGSDSNSSITNLNNRATSHYLNIDYADSAHMMTKAEADQNILRSTGSYYWLATVYDTIYLWLVYRDYVGGSNANSFGVRPVIVLKSNILTTGKGTDKVGQEAWTLVKP